MKHFKNPIDNSVWAYPKDGSQDHLIPDDFVEIPDSDVDAARDASYESYINSLPYSKQRLKTYPSIGDQLDALFHAGVFPEDMAAQIQAVKDKYPKG